MTNWIARKLVHRESRGPIHEIGSAPIGLNVNRLRPVCRGDSDQVGMPSVLACGLSRELPGCSGARSQSRFEFAGVDQAGTDGGRQWCLVDQGKRLKRAERMLAERTLEVNAVPRDMAIRTTGPSPQLEEWLSISGFGDQVRAGSSVKSRPAVRIARPISRERLALGCRRRRRRRKRCSVDHPASRFLR